MAWKIEFDPSAERELNKLDKNTAKQILLFLFERIKPIENPRSIGEDLKGTKFKSLWKYRVGDYRIIVDITDKNLLVLVVRIGNRKEVYKN